MTRLFPAVTALLLIFSAYAPGAQAQNPEGVGVVVDIHWPSQPNHLRYNVGNGDVVTGRYGYYRPPGYYNLPITHSDNNVLIITKPISKARTYIMFEGVNIDPELLKKKLGRLEGVIMDVGTDEWALQLGDQVHITTEDFYGATKVNLTFIRCGRWEPIAEFSFVNHLIPPHTQPSAEAAPYIPYISQIE
ncbi:MAG: hypothetical protein RIG61_07225 [Deltaproteobacteria bacterium]